MINGLYFQSVIEDRKREVSKIGENNQLYRQLRDSTTSQRVSDEQGKNMLNLWLLMVAKRIKGVFAVNNKDSVKV